MVQQIVIDLHSDQDLYIKVMVWKAKSKLDVTPIKPVETSRVQQIESLIEELTEDEKKILDLQLSAAHESDDTPVLNSFKGAKVTPMKLNRSREIIEYFRENPGAGRADCAEYLATKLAAHYPSRAIAVRRLGIMVANLCHRKELYNNTPGVYGARYYVKDNA